MAVPVLVEGRPVFILFLGTCWTGRGRPPHPKLPVVRARAWLEDRLELARATACRLAELMRTGNGPPDTRREAVLTFLHEKIDSPVRLADVARVLGLSESRSGHVIRELFGLTLPQLIATVKLFEAARLLSLTDHTVAEIAAGLGYCDQSHFSNAFRRHYRTSPLAYRRRHKSAV
jgi:AraC-like DNA-binding protein